jgi:hypothetical protein
MRDVPIQTLKPGKFVYDTHGGSIFVGYTAANGRGTQTVTVMHELDRSDHGALFMHPGYVIIDRDQARAILLARGI